MSKVKKCERCRKDLSGGIYASVWSSDRGEAFYCHDDESDCYSPATWDGYPELAGREVLS